MIIKMIISWSQTAYISPFNYSFFCCLFVLDNGHHGCLIMGKADLLIDKIYFLEARKLVSVKQGKINLNIETNEMQLT